MATISETVKRVVADGIARRVWREAAEKNAVAFAKGREERDAVKRYVKEQFDAAGAGFSGRWQS